MTRLAVGLVVVLSLPLVLPILPAGVRATYSETCTTLPFLLLALAAYRRRLAGSLGEERRFWRSMIAGVACWVGQQIVLVATYFRPASVTVELVDDIFYVGLYLFLILALDARPHLGPSPGTSGPWGASDASGRSSSCSVRWPTSS